MDHVGPQLAHLGLDVAGTTEVPNGAESPMVISSWPLLQRRATVSAGDETSRTVRRGCTAPTGDGLEGGVIAIGEPPDLQCPRSRYVTSVEGYCDAHQVKRSSEASRV